LTDPDATKAGDEKRGRPRRIAVATLLGLGTLVLFVGVFSVWVNRQVLNTDNWVNTSTRLLANEHVQEQLTIFLVAQAYESNEVEGELEKELPPAAKQLAGPITGGLRQLSERVAERALDSPALQHIWEEANRSAHEQLLEILDGGNSFVSTGEGTVTLHLRALLEKVGTQAGLPPAVLEKLPPDAGNVTVLKSSELAAVQTVAKLIRRLPVVLTILMALLYAAAIYLARGRRRQTLRAVGFGFVIAGIGALAVRSIAGNAIVSTLSSTDSVEEAVSAAWGIGTSLLVEVAVSTLAFGVLLVLAAWAAGRTALATGLRRQAAPWLREKPAAAYLVLGLVWLALIAWVPIAAFQKPLGILVFAILFAVGAWLYTRQALEEFPDAQPVSFRQTMRRLWRSDDRKPASAPGVDDGADPVGRLERLNALRAEGALSSEEYEAAKRKVLAAP
jgi:uncharacterized membrane protein